MEDRGHLEDFVVRNRFPAGANHLAEGMGHAKHFVVMAIIKIPFDGRRELVHPAFKMDGGLAILTAEVVRLYRLGHGPAKYFRLKQTGAMVGFVGALTNEHFCDQCNKMRLTADGKVRPCLGNHVEVDLRAALRSGASDDALRELLETALRVKPFEHQFRNQYQPCRPMTAIGG